MLIKPNFVEGLDSFLAEHSGPYGKIVSSWKKENKLVIYTVTIPPGSSATIWLKCEEVLLEGNKIEEIDHANLVSKDDDFTIIQIVSGTYEFKIEI